MKKIFQNYNKNLYKFYVSGAIHRNNISEILILFEYFRNMYTCHTGPLYRNFAFLIKAFLILLKLLTFALAVLQIFDTCVSNVKL